MTESSENWKKRDCFSKAAFFTLRTVVVTTIIHVVNQFFAGLGGRINWQKLSGRGAVMKRRFAKSARPLALSLMKDHSSL
jgi:hypothetical protein